MATYSGQLVITVTGPSGAGKDAVMQGLVAKDDKIVFFPTATTRDPRQGEVDGVDYYFISKKDFRDKIETGEILEHNEIFGRLYGTLKPVIEEKLAQKLDVISDMNSDGMFQLRGKMPKNHVSLLILPPSLKALEARIAARKTKTGEDETYIEQRFAKIRKDLEYLDANPEDENYEFMCDDLKNSCMADYDYVIFNDDLQETIDNTFKIIDVERLKRRT